MRSPAQSLRLIVELDAGEPVAGWMAREGEEPVRFDGLLGMLLVLHQLRDVEVAAPPLTP